MISSLFVTTVGFILIFVAIRGPVDTSLVSILSHTHTHTLSLSHTHTLFLSLSHTHTLFLSHTHAHTHSHIHTHSFSLTHTLSLTHTHTLSHTHTHTQNTNLAHMIIGIVILALQIVNVSVCLFTQSVHTYYTHTPHYTHSTLHSHTLAHYSSFPLQTRSQAVR